MQIKNRLSMADADTKYLRLDCSNDPLTGTLTLNGIFEHTGEYLGFYGATPVVRASGWSAVNYEELRNLDGDTATVGDIFNALVTLIVDFKKN